MRKILYQEGMTCFNRQRHMRSAQNLIKKQGFIIRKCKQQVQRMHIQHMKNDDGTKHCKWGFRAYNGMALFPWTIG